MTELICYRPEFLSAVGLMKKGIIISVGIIIVTTRTMRIQLEGLEERGQWSVVKGMYFSYRRPLFQSQHPQGVAPVIPALGIS